MRLEIVSAVDFLMELLRVKAHLGQLSESQLQMFRSSLTKLLRSRYRDHWYPDTPSRGSGYRCLRINGKIDPVIAQAGINVGLGPVLLQMILPSQLTIWVDPAEVSYRIGENGSFCALFESAEGQPPDTLDDHHQYHLQQHHQHHQYQQHHHLHHQQQKQQQQQFESCKDSLVGEYFSEALNAFAALQKNRKAATAGP